MSINNGHIEACEIVELLFYKKHANNVCDFVHPTLTPGA